VFTARYELVLAVHFLLFLRFKVLRIAGNISCNFSSLHYYYSKSNKILHYPHLIFLFFYFLWPTFKYFPFTISVLHRVCLFFQLHHFVTFPTTFLYLSFLSYSFLLPSISKFFTLSLSHKILVPSIVYICCYQLKGFAKFYYFAFYYSKR
jgi:hypothetical protein